MTLVRLVRADARDRVVCNRCLPLRQRPLTGPAGARPTTGDPALFAALAQVREERQTVFPLRTAENLKGGAGRALMLAPP